MEISFNVPGNPIAKGRARSFLKNGVIRHFTPEKTVRYEQHISAACMKAMGGLSPIIGEVSLDIVVHMPIPKSWAKKKKELALSGAVPHLSKPDLSNIIKAIEDGMNGIAFCDDSQIIRLSARKCYSDDPRVVVTVSSP